MQHSGPRSRGVVDVLITEEQLRAKVAELGRQLDGLYPDSADDPPLLVGVLTGAVTFMSDLMRAMVSHIEIDFMAVSSYGASTRSSGVVRILKDLDHEIAGRRVVVVEDIVDSGLTLRYLLDVLRRREPRGIRVVALLRKAKADAPPVQVDLMGFEIPDEFVVGYGLDFAGLYRNLPYVAILDPDLLAHQTELSERRSRPFCGTCWPSARVTTVYFRLEAFIIAGNHGPEKWHPAED